jgi:Ca-activated chloride channel family protein
MNHDPNKTILGGGPVDGRTQAMTELGGAEATQAMTAAKAVDVRVIPGREATIANGPAREQFLIELVGVGGSDRSGVGFAGARTPLNLCLAIDRSGSMEGPPLEYVKQAVGHVVDLLGPDDVLSLVTFEEVVDLLMPPQRVTSKQPIKEGVARIAAGNTTNLYDGIALAAQQLAAGAEGGRATRLVVLTDGEPTAGIRDFAALVAQAGEIRSRGISATFLGFGPEYNEELLAAMAKKAGGNYYYVPSPELIPEVFRAELAKLMTVVARGLRLQMRLARWVSLRGASGVGVTPSEREFTLDLADLERGATLHQAFDLDFPNHPLGLYRVAGGRLTYEDVATGASRTEEIDLVIEFTADAARYSSPVHPRVAQAMEVAAASRAVERTVMGLKTGALTAMGAMDELHKTQALLLRDGRVAEAQQVTLALRALQQGDASGAEKTLMGTVVNLDQGKREGP